MTKYKVKQSSPLIYMLSWIFITVGLFLIFIFLGKNLNLIPKGKPIIFVLVSIAIVLFAFYISKIISTVDTVIILNDNGLEKKWMSQFLLSDRENVKINWSEISDYVFQPDRYFDQFKLSLKNGGKFKLYHNNDYDNKDDFQKFLSDFIGKVQEINSNNSEIKKIQKGKTIYESAVGLILAGFSILVIIGIPILLIIVPTNKNANYGLIAFGYIGAIYFLIQVFLHRQKAKKKKI
jgi:hypothetical protein